MQNIFREYDIRGIFGSDLNEQSVKLIGYFLGKKIKELGGVVSIGYDARLHSPILKDYLASGLNESGCKVLDMGMVATPVNYFSNFVKPLESEDEVNGSIMITGSHNPPEYNGFKITIDKKPFFGEEIYALGREVEEHFEMEMGNDNSTTLIDTKSAYIEYITNHFLHLKALDKEIVIDGGNGVVGTVLPQIFDNLGLKYRTLFINPDGTFPNHHPDPSEEKNLIDVKAELAKGGDIAFAYDGDADRIAVMTNKYNIKGDQMALLFASAMQTPTVIGEVKCSQVMYDELEKRGAKAIMYKTGHSNLKVKMRETNAHLACEVSGHIFFADRYFGYDDAVYATLRMLELVADGVDLDKEIESLPKVYSTEEIKVKTTDKEKFAIITKLKELLKTPPADFPKIKDIIEVDGVRVNFEKGWGLVRASNTTPVLVTRFESTDENMVKWYENSLNELIMKAQREL
ncbi:MAG: phosphomannomutase/phosphoglucomutase [Sulfurovum sp.]|nr:MAG: phosphomannomutase/phosphoglucomutase [Sulfurovum sp.]